MMMMMMNIIYMILVKIQEPRSDPDLDPVYTEWLILQPLSTAP